MGVKTHSHPPRPGTVHKPHCSLRAVSLGFSPSRRLLAALLAALLLAPLGTAGGCYRRVSYQSPEGRRVEVVNFGFDTRIAGFEAQTSEGRLRIEGADSRARLADRLTEALLRELAGAAGGAP